MIANMYTILILLFSSLCFSNGQSHTHKCKHITTLHNHLVKQFRKLTDSLNTSTIETIWIKQPVDHFNSTDAREWKMKVFQNLDKWRQRGPVYIFIGGEGPVDESILKGGIVHELAEETNGAMFATEHRYYGDDRPFINVTRDNLRFLSSSQALADLANFIKGLKQSEKYKTSKVVVIGGSYAGNLATWMRLHYPQLVDAAIASSAPVLAKMDYPEFFGTVGDAFKKYATPECFASINNEMSQLKQFMTSEAGIEQFKHEYRICEDSDMTKKENQALFFYGILDLYTAAAQYGSPEVIRHYCDEKANSVKKLNVSNYCIKIDFDSQFEFNNATQEHNYAIMWFHQTCTEFGYFLTAPNNQPFAGVTLDIHFYTKICSRLFGSQFNEMSIADAIERTNDINGGLKPNVTNVIFVHGEIDPWHKLGITNDLSESAPARIIPGASHCNDLLPDCDEISEEVKKMKREEKDFIKKCIGF